MLTAKNGFSDQIAVFFKKTFSVLVKRRTFANAFRKGVEFQTKSVFFEGCFSLEKPVE